MKWIRFAVVAVIVHSFVAVNAWAEHGDVRENVLARLKTLETKLVGLAEAIPQDKYTWRPGDGVRSVSEVFLHVASANYRLPGMIGTPTPDGIDARSMEKSTTGQAKVVSVVKASFAHVRQAVEKLSGDDLEKATKLFGRDSNYRSVLLLMTGHLSEHLGQTIAYARVNGVVPPWNQ